MAKKEEDKGLNVTTYILAFLVLAMLAYARLFPSSPPTDSNWRALENTNCKILVERPQYPRMLITLDDEVIATIDKEVTFQSNEQNTKNPRENVITVNKDTTATINIGNAWVQITAEGSLCPNH